MRPNWFYLMDRINLIIQSNPSIITFFFFNDAYILTNAPCKSCCLGLQPGGIQDCMSRAHQNYTMGTPLFLNDPIAEVTQTGNQMKRRRLIFPTVIPLGIIPKDEPRFTGVIVTIPSKGLRVRHCWVSGFTDVHTSHSNLAFRSDSQKIVLSHRENVFSTTVILHGEPFFVWSKGNFGSNVHPGARIVSGIVGNKTSAFPCTLKPHFFL